MKILVAWSGGKDSQAALIWAVERFGAKNIEAVFCDTGWEHEDTYKHVKFIADLLGVKLVILKSKKYNGFVDLAKKKGRMPSTTARFCTEELKTKPMIDYILSLKQHVIVIQGIRAEESTARSLMNQQCRYFRFYFEPYTNNSLKLSALKNKRLTKGFSVADQEKYDHIVSRLAAGKEDPKYHTYRKKEVIDFCKDFADDVLRPHFDRGGVWIMNYILNHGQPVNPLYYKGSKRVGCYPCIMCTKAEIRNIIENDYEHIVKIEAAEAFTGSTFFRPDAVPLKYRRGRDKKGNRIARILDVVDYIRDKTATGNMFAELEEKEADGRKCMSFYGICE